MKPEDALLWSQQPTSGSYHYKFSYTIYLRYQLRQCLKSHPFLLGFLLYPMRATFTAQYVLLNLLYGEE
jgi:hypothetical protein